MPEPEPVVTPEPEPVATPEPIPAPQPEPKVETPSNFTLSLQTVGQLANGITLFGGDVLKNSYQFDVPQAVIDLKGGTDTFTARLAFDLADGFLTSNTVISPSYDANALTPDVATTVNVVDMIKDISFHFPNIGGYYIEIQGGKFGLPFGVENTRYDHEIPFYWRPLAFEHFLGAGFNDLALQLGANVPISDTMAVKARYFLFNGRNEVQLDGSQYLQDPAHGIDVRFEMKDRFSLIGALSLVIGSAYHDMDTQTAGGIMNTSLDQIDATSGERFGYQYDVPGQQDFRLYTKDFVRNKMNILLGFGTDLNYKLDDNMTFGLAAEFYYSYRQIFNPEKIIDQDGNPATDDLFSYRFLEDASGAFYGQGYYWSYGFFAAPYAHLWDFDAMIRFSMSKQPYLYTFVEDQKNYKLGLDVMLNYNVTDYFQAGIDWRWVQETRNVFDAVIDPVNYVKNTYNTHQIMLHALFHYEALLVK